VYAGIFTEVTFDRVFTRMESLKEICFVGRTEIPAVSQWTIKGETFILS